MGTRHGLAETALAYWRDYAVAGLGMVAVFGSLSIPAAAVVWTAYPDGKSLFVLGVLSLSVHMGAAYVRDVQTGEYDPSENTDFVLEHALLVTGVLLLYVTPLILTGTIGGLYVGQATGAPLVGLVVALYYPVVDHELLRRGVPSPSVLPLLGLFGVLHAVGLCRDVSPQQVIRRFRQRPPMPRI